jgi:hypothetical protein
MATEDHPRSTLITRVGRLFFFGSFALIAVTLSQLLVLLGPTGPAAARPMTYSGSSETLMFLSASLLLYALTLSSSFALLKRLVWARPAFIGILGVGIVLNVAKLVWSHFGPDQPALPAEGPAPYLFILRGASVLDVLLPLGTIAIFGWLIAKLNSAPIRDEFSRS